MSHLGIIQLSLSDIAQYLTAFKCNLALRLCDSGLYKDNTTISINHHFQKSFYKWICASMQPFEHSSVTLAVITHPISNARRIINHRLHTS